MPLSPEYVERRSAIEEHQISMASGSLPTYTQFLRVDEQYLWDTSHITVS